MKLKNKAAHPLVVVYRQHGAPGAIVIASGVDYELYESPTAGADGAVSIIGVMLVVPTLASVDRLDEHQHLGVTR